MRALSFTFRYQTTNILLSSVLTELFRGQRQWLIVKASERSIISLFKDLQVGQGASHSTLRGYGGKVIHSIALLVKTKMELS